MYDYPQHLTGEATLTRTLKKKAAVGQVEVEDITRLAKTPSQEHAEILLTLAKDHTWEHHPCFPRAPLATWAEVVARFCVDGFDGLIYEAADNQKWSFVLGVIEEIPSNQALTAALQIGKSELAAPKADLERSLRLVQVLNSLGRNKIQSQKVQEVREFLNQLLTTTTNEAEIGTVMCALRWYGDDGSIALIRAKPKMPDHWESARRAAIRAIKKRAKAT